MALPLHICLDEASPVSGGSHTVAAKENICNRHRRAAVNIKRKECGKDGTEGIEACNNDIDEEEEYINHRSVGKSRRRKHALALYISGMSLYRRREEEGKCRENGRGVAK